MIFITLLNQTCVDLVRTTAEFALVQRLVRLATKSIILRITTSVGLVVFTAALVCLSLHAFLVMQDITFGILSVYDVLQTA